MVPGVDADRGPLSVPAFDIARLPAEIGADRVATAIVVDVLRATTTMAAMLDAGCVGITTASSVDEARSLRAEDPDALLAGECGGVPPTGFDLGNSPLPAALDCVNGRRVVLTTTNGTVAVRAVETLADEVLTLALTNLLAVLDRIGPGGRDVLVVCSGTDGSRSVEDELAAGLLADRLGEGWTLSERAEQIRRESVAAIERHGGVAGAVAVSHHARRLDELGFGDDVAFCVRVGSTRTVPVLGSGRGMFVAG